MTFKTCRGCGITFTHKGWSAQSLQFPRLCKDCVAHEQAYHPIHSPQSKCLKEAMA
jgi:hypothetical protein